MTRTQYGAPPPAPNAVMLRRIVSVPIIVLLFTAAVPFTPLAWITGDIDGAFLIDRFVAGPILIAALYFQFALAGLTYPVAVALPNLSQGSDNYISNGQMRAKSAEMVFYYHPSNYWTYVAAEIALLVAGEFGRMEYLRRVIVAGVVGALWAVGWMITPNSTKQWAWTHLKALWFWVVLDLIRDIGFGGGRRRSRR